jgi:hypothetical protein
MMCTAISTSGPSLTAISASDDSVELSGDP